MEVTTARIQDGSFEAFKDYEFFFQSFLFYAAETNKFIDNELAKERVRYESYIKELKERPGWGRENFLYVLDLRTKEGMADIYFDSLLITLYSFVEKKMLQLCKYYERNQAFKVADLKDDGIIKYRKYLEKAAGFDFRSIPEVWDELLNFKKLRNNLVHSDGVRFISSKDNGLINFLKRKSSVELKEDGDGYVYHIKHAQLIFDFHRCAKFFIEFLFYKKVPFEETTA